MKTISLLLLLATVLSTNSLIFDFLGTKFGFLESVLHFIGDGARTEARQPKNTERLLPVYDFIVVGAGSAGSVITNRLTEIENWNVLLLEAGDNENYIQDIPILATYTQFTSANWHYKAEPSEGVCQSMENKQCLVPRGKVLGGSSTINFMINTRGNRRNYDEWEAMGNDGWNWGNVLPYFKKLEDMTNPELISDRRYHSTGGEVTVSYAPYRTKLADAFVEGGRQMGFNIVDYNGETQTGFSYLQSTIRNGTRCSASSAYLQPIRNRSNFHIRKRSLVTKILIDPETKRAYGVKFETGRKTYTVHARKEVILCGGVINSPQILMLSGIGPRDHLEQLGIPVIQDLKVGFNLMDHPAFPTEAFLVNETVGLVTKELIPNFANYNDFLMNHRGPFTIPAGCEGIAFFDTNNIYSLDGDPNLEFLFFSVSEVSDPSVSSILGFDQELYDTVYRPFKNRHSWLAIPIGLKPKSRGRVMLRSTDPHQHPLIYHNFLEATEDIELLVYGIKLVLELSKTPAFQKYDSKLIDIPIPNCVQYSFGSDDYWRCAVRNTAFGVFHISGTCKMGSSSDPDAVVDPRLRVYGVKGLRVVDSSIIPVVPAAHTNVPSMMIGEKAADMIKEDCGVF